MVFENLTKQEVEILYKKFKKQGLNEDDIFNEIYAIDCNLDE